MGLLAISSCLFVASAQVSSPADQTSQNSMVIANVGIVDVEIKEENGVIVGKYSLQGYMGQQNDINVGVIAVASSSGSHATVDVKRLIEKVSVQEKQITRYDFSYTIPTSLQGEVTFYLQASTVGGVVLSMNPLVKKVFSSKNQKTLTCTSVNGSIDCSRISKGNIIFSVSKNTILNTPVSVETKEVAVQGGHISFGTTLPPGKYYVDSYASDTHEHIVLPLTVQGVYATIMNSLITQKQNGSPFAVVAISKSIESTNLSARITLTDIKGESCGTASKSFEKNIPIVVIDITSSCNEGTSRTEIVDSKGGVLDVTLGQFSLSNNNYLENKTQENDTKAETVSRVGIAPYVGGGVLVLGLIIAALYINTKRKSQSGVAEV